MDIGLFAPLRSPVCTPALLDDLGPQAEEMGIHSLWMGEHVVLFRSGQRLHRGKAHHESIEVRNNGRDLRLLKHDLGNPYRIRRGVSLPRQVVPTVILEPRQQASSESVHGARLLEIWGLCRKPER